MALEREAASFRPLAETEADCSICGTPSALRHRFVKWGIPIAECSSCRTASAALPSDFDPAAFYDNAYYQGGRADSYADYAGSELVIRREARRVLGELAACGISRGRLLEIGSAYGFLIKEAQSQFGAIGVEISETARARSREAGLPVYENLDDAEVLQKAPYNALVLLDCIEHFADPRATLQKAVALLDHNAAVVISTGDWGSVPARLMGKRWRLMTPPQHLYFFTRQGLGKLLENLGFEIVSFARPWRHVPVGLAAYQFAHRLGLNWQPPSRLNKVGVPLNLFDCMQVVARRVG